MGWTSQITSVCNQPPRPTQPPIFSKTGNEYWPKWGDAGMAHSIWGCTWMV